ncbi:MAG: 2-hydroxyacyl-CoA dehydratase [Anaerocolumna sp.]|jgi:predicted CoA-substrate-specific enzyme activase|nr:2-hydroxyacyl-CoA dehydratase [Anaerocolumna sp.]
MYKGFEFVSKVGDVKMSKYKIGLDVGSTTVKLAVLYNENVLIYSEYKRHLSDVKRTIIELIQNCYDNLGDIKCTMNISGSSGLSVSKWLGINFVQEVIACSKSVETIIPETDVVIELGGEDAKITYFRGGIEQRMNGSCAGGTGAFIDQMATLLNTDASGLNEYAKDYKVIYPIASRCGVFAKTDIQPLINDGARKEDIAASIFQAVVNQTIGGLACGKPIRGKIAFLGGPLYFLSELRNRFIDTLHLSEDNAVSPIHSQLYVAIGAALLSSEEKEISLGDIKEKADDLLHKKEDALNRLVPLFKDELDYKEFIKEHQYASLKREELSNYSGNVFLGIDAGSTTTKIALIGENAELLYTYYGSNEGDPLKKIVAIMKDLYQKLPTNVSIAKSTVTGYGEALIKAALHIDLGEIETIAHYKAADFFLPGVDFILDIGGQDMKCLRIKNGAIDSILLNEACSSGCGSFIEGFATSLNLSVNEFAKAALFSSSPVDLGSKCTVFMNSRVKQAQKEGADIADLSAGLSYSVIKNALYKVIKIKSEKDLGEKIIVQGGTFYNDAVLRSFELISGRKAVRPDIAGLMGAFGAALIAKERFHEELHYKKSESLENIEIKNNEIKNKELFEIDNLRNSNIETSYLYKTSSILPYEELENFTMKSSFRRCSNCGNHCLLTINEFSNGESYTAGNRCEKGLGIQKKTESKVPNLVEYKYKRTFAYKPLKLEDANRGVIGIPRVLNMFENYPFWFTLLTELGFRVIVSSPSSKKLYESGLETIPSESACYPAKLCHGHVMDLMNKGIKTIFYPSVAYEKKEFQDANNHFNCPIVTSYPEVIKHNMDDIKVKQITYLSPFVSLNNYKALVKRVVEEFRDYHVTIDEAKRAVDKAAKEREQYKKDIQQKGEEAIAYIREHHMKGIVLCGKPYHIDPEINHGIPDLIASYDMAILTEDSISHLSPLNYKLRVVDQWMYNSRLYRAASFVKKVAGLDLIQLNSFGCGLDAVTTDQIAEILASGGKMYTMLKIDEGNNLGAAKIRIRSLKAAMEERERVNYKYEIIDNSYYTPKFTKQMKKQHTILAPQMAPIHFELVKEAAKACGYQLEVLPAMDQKAVDEGLKLVNNDACFPAVIMVGQIVSALKSGQYDVNNTSVIISQTGGGCRATNYIGFLKMGLKQAGFEQVPIISMNFVGLEKQPGFKLSLGLINRSIMALVYGDLFMRVLYRTRPYEMIEGSANGLYEKWNDIAIKNIRTANKREFNKNIREIINEFDHLDVIDMKKPKVAVVGEILLKYHPTANNDIVNILEQSGAEAVVPDLLDFFFYSSYNSRFKYKYLAGKRLIRDFCNIATVYMKQYRKVMMDALDESAHFTRPSTIDELAEMASSVVSLGNQTGEGWLVTAEMIEFIKSGTSNIICVQPLACLPNHVTGKGMFKPLKEKYPKANIVPIDYDPGISHVNQLNRIKLMLSVAVKNLKDENES